MRKSLAGIACALWLSSSPAFAQSGDKQKEMQKGQTMFYVGLGIAATGLTPLFMGNAKSIAIGAPLVAGGGALAYYGHKKKNQARARPSIQFGVVPLRKGVAFGVARRW